MLSEEEKREMLEMANSAKLREEFRKMALKEYPVKGEGIDLDWYLAFLTLFSRIFDTAEYQKKKLTDFLKSRKDKKFIL